MNTSIVHEDIILIDIKSFTRQVIVIFEPKDEKKIPSDMCTKRKLKSACGCVQSIGLRSTHEKKSLHSWLS